MDGKFKATSIRDFGGIEFFCIQKIVTLGDNKWGSARVCGYVVLYLATHVYTT
jgi:hypothetical protein